MSTQPTFFSSLKPGALLRVDLGFSVSDKKTVDPGSVLFLFKTTVGPPIVRGYYVDHDVQHEYLSQNGEIYAVRWHNETRIDTFATLIVGEES